MNQLQYGSQDPEQNIQPSAKQWFDSVGGAPPSPEPPKSKKKIVVFIVTGIGLVLCILAFTLAMLTLSDSKKNNNGCFEQSNYRELINGLKSDDELKIEYVQAKKSLYLYPVYFIEKMTTYNPDTKNDTEEILKTISSFDRDHRSSAPIVVSLHATYSPNETQDIAKQRTKKLQDSLLRLGMSASAIKIDAPTPTKPQDDYTIDGIPTLINIIPQSVCQT